VKHSTDFTELAGLTPEYNCAKYETELEPSRSPALGGVPSMSMHWISEPEAWIALLTLTSLEIVLGIDNIIFIGILAGNLPISQRGRARTIGLSIGMGLRIILLFSLTFVMRWTVPLFTVLRRPISGRDLILLAGGLFLIAKTTSEIHSRLEGKGEIHEGENTATFGEILVQIALLDLVFSVERWSLQWAWWMRWPS
jgi:predicted tellurium resistance membrane protein TerC